VTKLAGAGIVECPTHNGFIYINITIPDFQVEAAIRISANPRFVVNSCPLTAKIRQGYQVTRLALLTFREIRLFHEVLLPTEIDSLAVYNK
jgi:hypothetical protein